MKVHGESKVKHFDLIIDIYKKKVSAIGETATTENSYNWENIRRKALEYTPFLCN